MPLNKTKTDILLTLTELMYYCPYSFDKMIAYTMLDSEFKFQSMTNKQVLEELKLLLGQWKKYPSKKGQTR